MNFVNSAYHILVFLGGDELKGMRSVGRVAGRGGGNEKGNACMVQVEKLAGKTPTGRRKYRWNNIELDVKDVAWEGPDWNYLLIACQDLAASS